jgi:Arc/MetJ family transcription regulator
MLTKNTVNKVGGERLMKRTSLALDERLLEEAVEAIGARTKKEAVEAGLKALIRMKQKEMLRKDLGTFDMDLSLSELEELRSAG